MQIPMLMYHKMQNKNKRGALDHHQLYFIIKHVVESLPSLFAFTRTDCLPACLLAYLPASDAGLHVYRGGLNSSSRLMNKILMFETFFGFI